MTHTFELWPFFWGRKELAVIKKRFDERRRFERFEVKMPLVNMDITKEKEIQAYTRDISDNGLGFVCKEAVEAGDLIDVKIKMADNAEEIRGRGVIVWVQPFKKRYYRAGVILDDQYYKAVQLVLRTIKTQAIQRYKFN